MSACINAALEQTDGTIHADRDIPAGDVKVAGDLLGRQPLVQAQLDHLAVGSWQEIDHFPEQDKQFPFLRKSFRAPSRGRLVFERTLSAADLFSVELLRRVADDLMNPRTGLRSAKGGMIEGLENLDPTGLKDIVGEIVVAGDPPGEGKEAAGAAGNPGFAIAFKQGAIFSGLLQFGSGQDVKIVGHEDCSCVQYSPQPQDQPTAERASPSEREALGLSKPLGRG